MYTATAVMDKITKFTAQALVQYELDRRMRMRNL
jgi:hypothetical protein